MPSNFDAQFAERPLRVLLVAGPKDHGSGEHDYPAWQIAWAEMLDGVAGLSVETAFVWPSAEQWRRADLVVLYFRNRDWLDAQYRDLDRYTEHGGGLVLLHCAMVANHDPRRLASLIGISGQRPQLQFRHGNVDLQLDARHAIAAGDKALALVDETYWELSVHPVGVEVLGTSVEANRVQPQLWTYERGGGRVFGAIPGHYMTTFDYLPYRHLLARGLAWATRASVERFVPFVDSARRVAAGH